MNNNLKINQLKRLGFLASFTILSTTCITITKTITYDKQKTINKNYHQLRNRRNTKTIHIQNSIQFNTLRRINQQRSKHDNSRR
ncbi:MAG: hypothetical protein [Microviridae sp.]|nr:MAG: hypothetical protein [Microviridae sp.]